MQEKLLPKSTEIKKKKQFKLYYSVLKEDSFIDMQKIISRVKLMLLFWYRKLRRLFMLPSTFNFDSIHFMNDSPLST